MQIKYILKKFTKKITFTKIGLLIPPFFINILVMRLIDGQPSGWAKGNVIQNRIVSSFFLISILSLFFVFIYINKTQFKIIPKYRILAFFLFWFTSLYLHASYFDYGTGLTGVLGSYILCSVFEISILIDIESKI
jgi:hypothetical protein